MEGDFFEPVLAWVLPVVSSVLAALLVYRIVARRRRLKLAEPAKKMPSLRLRPEVTAKVYRTRASASLTLTNVGGVEAVDVDFQAGWQVGRQEITALTAIEKYRLPLTTLPAGGSENFDLTFPDVRSPALLLNISWKNRAGRVDKRSLSL